MIPSFTRSRVQAKSRSTRRSAAVAAALTLGAGVGAGTVASAASAPACDDTTTIKWVTLIFFNTDPIEAAFEAENPCIDLEVELQPFPDLFEQIQIRLQSGSDMDVVSVDVPLTASYAVRGWLAPLDHLFTDEELADFLPAALDAGTVDGELVAAPSSNSTQLLFVNRDALSAAGVEPPAPDDRWTYEQILEAATTVTTDETFGFNWEQPTAIYQLGVLPGSLGGQMIGDDGFTVDGIINSPEWIQAFEFYQSVYASGVAPTGDAVGAVEAFTAGDLAMFVGGPWNIGDFAETGLDFDWGVSRHPFFDGGEVVTPTGSWHVGVNAGSSNIDAAGTFVHWLTTGSGAELWWNDGSRDFPAQQSLIARYETDPRFAEEPLSWLQIAAEESVTNPLPRAQTPGYLEYSDILSAAFSDIRSGADVQSTLDDAVSRITEEMEKYQS
jgi:ABC-type glycerol-3-phosphate transport system substrate-binding protein